MSQFRNRAPSSSKSTQTRDDQEIIENTTDNGKLEVLDEDNAKVENAEDYEKALVAANVDDNDDGLTCLVKEKSEFEEVTKF